MRRFLLIIAVLLGSIGMFAQPRSEQQAQQIASKFFSQKPRQKAPRLSVVPQQTVSQTIRKKVASAKKAPATQASSCYVINDEANNRFVIVSADERLYEILGYSDNGCFNAEKAPEGLLDMINGYDAEYDYVLKNATLKYASTPQRETTEAIAPLIASKWGQGSPYNLQCPLSSQGTTSVSGCVATAMAQVMNYWKYPKEGRGGVVSYSTKTTNTPQKMNYDTLRIDWSNIVDAYNKYSTAAQNNEVAKLMHACGISVFMDYDTGSGAYSWDIPEALINHFGLNSNLMYVSKYYYSNETWNNMIIHELENGRPILYSGVDLSYWAGHQFILDGVDNDRLYHFNFGWNGSHDGYYSLDAISPSPYNFTFRQDMIINICPNLNGIHEDVFYFDSFDLKSSVNLGETLKTPLSFTCYSNQANSRTKWFDGSIGFGIFDENWDFVKPLLEVNVNRFKDNNKRIYLYANTELSVSGDAIKMVFDNATFGTEGKQQYIAPYVVDSSNRYTRGRTYGGEKDWYRATTKNGKVILEPLKLIEDPVQPNPIHYEPIQIGTYDVTALDNMNQKTLTWQINVTQDGTDTTKYYFHNFDKALTDKGYTSSNNANRVYGIMNLDGNIRIPLRQNLGDNWVLKNYTSTDSILVEISRTNSTMDIRKHAWGVNNSSTSEDLSRYSGTTFTYHIAPIPEDTVATPIIMVDAQQRMSISCATKDASIYYTYSVQGTEPTSSSSVYSSPITLWQNGVLKAIAINKEGKKSKVFTYIVESFTVAKPQITIADDDAHLISITCDTPSSTIYYTINGSKPSASVGTEYKKSFTCTETSTIQAIAVLKNWNDSPIDTLYYVIDPDPELVINNEEAGKLPSLISGKDKSNTKSLTVSGLLNGTDIKFIREMIIDGKLAYLDMKDASIVEGGDEYYTPSVGSGEITENNIIGQHMFDNCKNLVSLSLPQTATIIKSWNFVNCDALKELYIPSSCEKVENYAFWSAKSLERIHLSRNIVEFGGENCSNCPKLSTITVEDGNLHFKAIDGVLYENDSILVKYPRAKQNRSYAIPQGITIIGDHAFEHATFEEVTFPESVKFIKDNAFSNCVNLQFVEIPNSVESVARWAFSGCMNLLSVTMSDNTSEIASYVFYNCKNLQKFEIGSKVKEINASAFENCISLQEFDVAEDNPWFMSVSGIIYTKDMKVLNRCPLALYSEELLLPEGMEEIFEKAFNGCKNIQKVTIPSTLKHIGSSAFNGSSITSIQNPSDMEQIENWAFASCKELETFVIPENIEQLSSYLLYNCDNLRYIYIPKGVKKIGTNALYNCKALTTINCKVKDITSMDVDFSSYSQSYTSFQNIPDTCTWLVPSGPEKDVNKYVRKYQAQPWWVSTWRAVPYGEFEASTQTIELYNNTMRTFSSTGNLDFSEVEDLDAYIACGYSPSTSEVLLAKITHVPAKTGLVLIGKANTNYEVPYTETDFVYSNLLVGVLEDTDITSGYVLNGSMFEAVSEKQTVKSGEAYLNIAASEAKFLKMRIVDTWDGIDDVVVPTGQGAWHTLSGTRLSGKPTQKGIYLHNGHKVLVK